MLVPHPPTGPFNFTFMQQRRTGQSKKYNECLLLLHDNTTSPTNILKVLVYVWILWFFDCLMFC